MDYMREISTFLEDKAVVTTNWLAQELQISVRKAIDLVQDFKSNKSESFASYRVVYVDEFGGLQVAILNEQEVSLLQEQSYNVLSKQIYSVAKVDSSMNQSIIVDAALSQAEELLKSTVATEDSFLTNAVGEVHLSTVEIKAVGDRVFSAQNILFKVPSITASQSLPPVPAFVKAPSQSAAVSSSQSTSANKENNKAAPTTTTSTTIKKITKSNEDAAKKYFSSFVGAPKPLDPVLEERYVEGAGDDEEEWDDGHVKLADRQKMVQQVKADDVVEFSSQENEENKDKEAPVEEEAAESGKKRKAAKANILTRGAMDDYMEDVAIEEYKRKQQEDATGAPPLKKKKRVLVEKSFVDSDGYFVTEMVWDEVTDDESEMPAVNKAVEKMTPSASISKENNPTNEMKREASTSANKQPLKPKAPPKAAAAAGGGQKSMMSFFTKKA
eukprot:gene15684-11224_t